MQEQFKNQLAQEIETLKSEDLYRELKISDKNLINFCSNDYLGLTRHPKVIAAAQNAVKEYGTGSGASRLISGTSPIHYKLEEILAEFKGREKALVFSSGFVTNAGMIPALAQEDDTLLIDRLCHASIVDGCFASRAKLQVYPHKNMAALEKSLSHSQTYRNRFIITDAVFSMDGDIAPLPEIVELAKKYSAIIIVDEAHSTGVLGKTGKGIEEHFNLAGSVDILMGTLSKAIGSLGGFVAGDKVLIDRLVNSVRGFIYTTALAPANCAAAIESLEIISRDQGPLKKMRENTAIVKKALIEQGYNLGEAVNYETPILPIMLGTPAAALKAAQFMQGHGIFLTAIRPPTVARNECRLRLTVSALHTQKDIEKLITSFKNLRGALASTLAPVAQS